MSVWPLPRITFRELNAIEEKRPAALLTSEGVWAVLSAQLKLPVVIQAEPPRYSRDLFDTLAAHLPAQVRVIYAVGEGAPVEAGKVVAARNRLPLVIVPTALDSDLMLSPFALVEETADGSSRRVWDETGPASEVIVDWSLIESAAPDRRGAGIVDVLSIVTGLLDWRYSAQKGKNPREQRFVPWVAGAATGLAKESLKIAAAVGQGDSDALRTLLDLMMAGVQLCNQLGHTRMMEGGEHYLAQMIAPQARPTLAHAEIVGPCLLLVSALHGQPPAPLREALEAAGVRLDQLNPADLGLTLSALAAHLEQSGFPYSILNDLDPASEAVKKALDDAGLALPPDTWEAPEPESWEDLDAPGPVGISPRIEAPHEEKAPPGEETRPADSTADISGP